MAKAPSIADQPLVEQGVTVSDVVFVVLTIVLFALLALAIRGAERL